MRRASSELGSALDEGDPVRLSVTQRLARHHASHHSKTRPSRGQRLLSSQIDTTHSP